MFPRGITGISMQGEPPLPTIDFQAFLTDCHAAARSISARVIANTPAHDRYPENFGKVTISCRTGIVDVLVNAVHPVVGFANASTGRGTTLIFVDHPELAMALSQACFWQLLTAAQLNGPVEPHLLKDLGPAELEQIRYWKPNRLGDVIFNRWD